MPGAILNGIEKIATDIQTVNSKKMDVLKHIEMINNNKNSALNDLNNNFNVIKSNGYKMSVPTNYHIGPETETQNTEPKVEEQVKVEKKNKYGADYTTKGLLPAEIGTDYDFDRKIVWFNTIGFVLLHSCALYGVWLALTKAMWLTIGFSFLLIVVSGMGVTIGAHRMYSHKAFKATLAVRIALVVLQTIAGQNCMYIWVRDHRQHHKYSDTDADPHNAKRGFFFSHVGWLMSRKHPAVKSKGQAIDMSDLEADPVVMIQKIFYKPLYTVFALALPVAIPVGFWGESYWNSLFVAYFARYILLLNITWLVNSAAHIYGTRPYDRNLQPVESRLVSVLSAGEGWHNYHHAFPWDYRAAELGLSFSPTTLIIDTLAALGLVYDLKVAPMNIIQKRTTRLGDGTHPVWGTEKKAQENNLVNQLSLAFSDDEPGKVQYTTEEIESDYVKNEYLSQKIDGNNNSNQLKHRVIS